MCDWIHLEQIVEAPVERVWHAWTTDEGCRSFFARQTRVRLELGGPFEMLFLEDAPEGERGSEGCTFLSYVPGRMLSFTWNAPPQFAHARGRHTWVVLSFEAVEDDRTRVTLDHLGFREHMERDPLHADEWEQVRAYFQKAWPFVLGNLARRFVDGPRWESWQ